MNEYEYDDEQHENAADALAFASMIAGVLASVGLPAEVGAWHAPDGTLFVGVADINSKDPVLFVADVSLAGALQRGTVPEVTDADMARIIGDALDDDVLMSIFGHADDDGIG